MSRFYYFTALEEPRPTRIPDPKYKHYDAAIAADRAWSDELRHLYGDKAGDARYDARGCATQKLQALRDAKRAADDALRAACP